MSEGIPEGWSVSPLREHTKRVMRRNTIGNDNVLTISAQLGLVNQKEFFNKYVSSANLSNYFLLREGEFAYNKSYSKGYPVGVIKQLHRYQEGILSPLYICFKIINGELDADFAEYSFETAWVEKEIRSIAQQGARAHGLLNVSVGEFFDVELLLPPLPEQEKIASILTSVDEVIEKTEAQIGKLQDLKKGMMQELLTKGIGHTEYKDSPVGRIPREWDYTHLSEVLDKLIDCEHKTAPYVEKSPYLVVRTSNVREGQLLYEDIKYTTEDGFKEWTKRRTPKDGDILFTREAPAGESCLVPSGKQVCLGQRMVLLIPDIRKVSSKFVSWFLVSEIGRREIYKLSIGTTVTRINIEDIYKIPFLLPSQEEQDRIVAAIDSVDAAIQSNVRYLNSAKASKNALMQDLLTGRTRVMIGNAQ